MEQSTKKFNETMSGLMKQFREKEEQLFNDLLNSEKEKAQKLMMKSISLEDLRVKESWEKLVDLGLVQKQFNPILNDLFYSYSFKEYSDYFIVFKNNEFEFDTVKNALIFNNYAVDMRTALPFILFKSHN